MRRFALILTLLVSGLAFGREPLENERAAYGTAFERVASQDGLYDRVDELDDLSAHLNFAVAVHPAYVLDDGATGPSAKHGDGASHRRLDRKHGVLTCAQKRHAGISLS